MANRHVTLSFLFTGREPRTPHAFVVPARPMGHHSHHANRYLLDRVVAVPEPIPFGTFRLSTAREVRSATTQRHRIRFLNIPNQLPPLPAVTIAFADEIRFLPATPDHAHLHTRDRCRSGPRDAADRQFPRGHFRIG